MATYKSSHLIEMFEAIATAIEADKARLCELDGAIGDADHGIAMALGFGAARDALVLLDTETTDPTSVLNAAAKAFLNAVGASSGPLYATAFMRAGAAAKGLAALDDDALAAAFQAMAKGIQDRGKAQVGEKTMIDAWSPAAEAMAQAQLAGKDFNQGIRAALEAARAGAESTKAMVATKGRAMRLGERAVGHIDPGAASAVVVIEAMADSLTKTADHG